MATNPYAVLGVDPHASPAEIVSAYAHWAREFNPEHSGLESGSFQEVQDAFAVVGHPERRRNFDRVSHYRHPTDIRQPHPEPQRQRGAAATPIELSLRESGASYHPSFEEIFDRLWSNFGLLTRPKGEHIESLTLEIPLSREEAALGGQARIFIPARAECPACSGHGAIGIYECWHCRGQGSITADYPLEVNYPPAISNEYQAQIPLGEFGIENFYLTLRFRVTD